MYSVSPFVRHFGKALLAGVAVATVWVNLDPASYYDAVEFRLADLPLPRWMVKAPISLTPLVAVSHGLMALFLFFIGKELWEALVLERGAMARRSDAALPAGAVIGGIAGAALVWLIASALLVTAEEAGFGTGWPVPLGSDVVLCYVFGRRVFGTGHPALHLLLLITIAFDILGLLIVGLAYPVVGLNLVWLALPLLAAAGVWAGFGRKADRNASETARRRALRLWPYCLAGLVSYTGVALAGLPPALGLLPVIPAIPHADRSFGLFAEAEAFLHDPLNRLARALMRPAAWVLFLFGLTRGGIDFGAASATTVTVLAALWLGKPLGVLLGGLGMAVLAGARLPAGVRITDLGLIAVLSGVGFTVPVLALGTALPGGAMAEAARLGLAISLAAGPAAIGLARLRRG